MDLQVDWAPNCSHTDITVGKSWWQVVLSEEQKYVIYNITLINRVDTSAFLLRNFYIYVSNDTSAYPSGLWTICTTQYDRIAFSMVFKCRGTNIARSIVIELQENEAFLTLCEVYIGGYEFKDCGDKHTGPGCLLFRCDHGECKGNNGVCDPSGVCRFIRCPGNTHAPPYCWMTLSDFTSYSWMAELKGRQMVITGNPILSVDWPANSVALDVFSEGNELDYAERFTYSMSESGYLSLSFPVDFDGDYQIKLTPKLCFKDRVCLDGNQDCYTNPDCFESPSTGMISLDESKDEPSNITTKFECHCANVSDCEAEFIICNDGCKPPWIPPLCQIANMAFGKPATQSTTSRRRFILPRLASYAVDGIIPTEIANGDSNCSGTEPQSVGFRTWWVVQLTTRGYIVVTNVTIHGGLGAGSQQEQIYVIADNLTTIGPRPESLVICDHTSEEGLVSNFNCLYTSAKRVGVILRHYGAELRLCEVIVYGYPFTTCNPGKAGPGCLFRSCQSKFCRTFKGTCGLKNICQFPRCPDDTYWPPECVMRMPELSSISQPSMTCNKLSVLLPSIINHRLHANFLRIEIISTETSETLVSRNYSVDQHFVTGRLETFAIHSGQSYNLVLAALVCINGICNNGPKKSAIVKNKAIRVYYSVTGYCGYFTLFTMEPGCELPTIIGVECYSSLRDDRRSTKEHRMCGLKGHSNYTCTIKATNRRLNLVYYYFYKIWATSSGELSAVQIVALSGGGVGFILLGVAIGVGVARSVVTLIRRKKRQEIGLSSEYSLSYLTSGPSSSVTTSKTRSSGASHTALSSKF